MSQLDFALRNHLILKIPNLKGCVIMVMVMADPSDLGHGKKTRTITYVRYKSCNLSRSSAVLRAAKHEGLLWVWLHSPGAARPQQDSPLYGALG